MNVALTSGYHLGFAVAAGCVATAAIAGAIVLRGARPAVQVQAQEVALLNADLAA